MRVQFDLNLGLVDARKHGLDFTECKEGMQATVPGDAAAEFIRRGLATEIAEAEVRAVPPKNDPVKKPAK